MRLSLVSRFLLDVCFFLVFLQMLLIKVEFRLGILYKVAFALVVRVVFCREVRVSALDGALLASWTQDARLTMRNASSFCRLGLLGCFAGVWNLCLATQTGLQMLVANGLSLELKKDALFELLASASLSFSLASLDVQFPQNVQPASLLRDSRWICSFLRNKKFRSIEKRI